MIWYKKRRSSDSWWSEDFLFYRRYKEDIRNGGQAFAEAEHILSDAVGFDVAGYYRGMLPIQFACNSSFHKSLANWTAYLSFPLSNFRYT